MFGWISVGNRQSNYRIQISVFKSFYKKYCAFMFDILDNNIWVFNRPLTMFLKQRIIFWVMFLNMLQPLICYYDFIGIQSSKLIHNYLRLKIA